MFTPQVRREKRRSAEEAETASSLVVIRQVAVTIQVPTSQPFTTQQTSAYRTETNAIKVSGETKSFTASAIASFAKVRRPKTIQWKSRQKTRKCGQKTSAIITESHRGEEGKRL
jgi:hypothetical protein